MLTDSKLREWRNELQLAQQEVIAQQEYHRAVDGTSDDDEFYYDKSLSEYQDIIDAINRILRQE